MSNVHKNQIAYGAILSYFAIGFNIIAGLIYTPWMVRQIGKEQYGLYTLANSLITLFLVDFGLSAATTRYISKYHAEKNEEKVNQFLSVIYELYLIIDVVIFIVFIITFIFSEKIYNTLTIKELSQFKIVFAIAGAFSIICFPFIPLRGILISYELFIQQKLIDLFHKVLIIFLVVIALLNGLGLYALVGANAIAGLLSIFLKLLIIKKNTDIKVNIIHFDKKLMKEVFNFSIWVTIASLAQRLVFNITPSILGMVASSSAIAIFGIVSTIEGYTFTIASAISGMFMPTISRIMTRQDNHERLQNLLLNVGKFQFTINSLIVVGFIVLGKDFIVLWMGDNYIDAYNCIVLVTLPGIIYNSLEIGHTAIFVQNKVKITGIVNLIIGLVNVNLSLFLSRRYGALGACLSIFIAYMIRSIILLIIYNNELNLDIVSFLIQCYLRLTPVLTITIIIGIVIKKKFIIDNWLCFALNVFSLCLIYIIFLVTIGLNNNERKFVINMIQNHFYKK